MNFQMYCQSKNLDPESFIQIPEITNYTMKGRTYRYYTQDPLYPFGYGLSYSRFTYSNLKLSASTIEPGQQINMMVSVKNNGPYDAEEVPVVFLFHFLFHE